MSHTVAFTPGPWNAEDRTGAWGSRALFVFAGERTPDSQRNTVAVIADGAELAREANANLIAAAPDLLEACESALSFSENAEGGMSLARELRAAISKATGGQR